MSPPNLVQIPFSAFKTIDLVQHVALEVYQSLYDDHTEPVGLVLSYTDIVDTPKNADAKGKKNRRSRA